MPTTAGSTVRGLPYPGDTGAADGPASFKALADAIEAMMNSALVLAAAPTAPFFVADSATSAGLSMRDSGATAGLRRSYVINDDGHTYLRHPNDADSSVVNVGLDYNHLTGVVDLPNGFTGRRVDSPYFRAYRSTSHSRTTGQTVIFDTETDPNGWYDPATGIFLPTVAGRYRITWQITATTVLAADKYLQADIYKNGALGAYGQGMFQRGASQGVNSVGSVSVSADGASDSFQVIVLHDNGGSVSLGASSAATYFEAERIGA